MKTLLAWCAHAYTALGLVLAAGMAVAIFDGRPQAMRHAFLLMILATVVDATDGTLARLVKVKETLPGFDGRRLDDLIDFLTYTSLPLLLIWRARLLPAGQDAWLLVPLVASAYGFCQTDAKTPDGFFLGFPSYWNVIAFYLYVLQLSPGGTVGVLLAFALLTFVPCRYLYPTQRGRLNLFTSVVGAIWAIVLTWAAKRLPDSPPRDRHADDATLNLVMVSLIFPAYYLAVSWWLTWRVSSSLKKQNAGGEAMNEIHAPDRP